MFIKFILESLKWNEAFSVSGQHSMGKEDDLVPENKNKRLKRLTPNGLPGQSTCVQVCISFDTLDELSI